MADVLLLNKTKKHLISVFFRKSKVNPVRLERRAAPGNLKVDRKLLAIAGAFE